MITIESDQVFEWLDHLEQGLRDHLSSSLADFAMIGIRTGGVTVARQLHQRLGLRTPLGELNISFYRDDFSRIGLHPVVGASELPFAVEERPIILVDDVLSSGRTVRAALNEIFDFGRPSQVTLAVLIAREGRELPICADVTGHNLTLAAGQQIKLNPETMQCLIKESEGE